MSVWSMLILIYCVSGFRFKCDAKLYTLSNIYKKKLLFFYSPYKFINFALITYNYLA